MAIALAISVLVVVFILVAAAVAMYFYKPQVKEGFESGNNACSLKTCGAIDPVSDPAYNMKEIIKQSVLLEEHLVEPNKRCGDCICKHFFTIVALAEESVSLAGTRVGDYPYMTDNVAYYGRVFDEWLGAHKAAGGGDVYYLRAAEELRKRRKELVAAYVLGQ